MLSSSRFMRRAKTEAERALHSQGHITPWSGGPELGVAKLQCVQPGGRQAPSTRSLAKALMDPSCSCSKHFQTKSFKEPFQMFTKATQRDCQSCKRPGLGYICQRLQRGEATCQRKSSDIITCVPRHVFFKDLGVHTFCQLPKLLIRFLKFVEVRHIRGFFFCSLLLG